jgi:hypothetical protein
VTGPENIFLHKDEKALCHIENNIPGMERECRDSGIRLYVQLPKFRKPDVALSEPAVEEKALLDQGHNAQKDNCLLCYWPWESLFILLGGKVKPYGFCRQDVCWDLNETTLSQMWNNTHMQEYRKKIIAHKYDGFCDPRCYSGVISKDLLGREIK